MDCEGNWHFNGIDFINYLLFSNMVTRSLVIQLKYRKQNIDFTRRFHDKFGDMSRLVAFIPWMASIVIIFYIGMLVKGDIDFEGWLILGLGFLSLIRIFDPLLGCLVDPNLVV